VRTFVDPPPIDQRLSFKLSQSTGDTFLSEYSLGTFQIDSMGLVASLGFAAGLEDQKPKGKNLAAGAALSGI
jgi:hypothetical protein